MLWTGSFEVLPEQEEEPDFVGPSTRDLGEEDLGVVFQPIVDLHTGLSVAHEALVRCSIQEYQNPLVLFEQATRENTCGRLGRSIREVTFRKVEGPVFVNIHPNELSSRWLVRPDDPLNFHNSSVYLEITESATFTHFDLCMSVLREICHRTGAFLVVDDFGAGYSNLSRIIELEPAYVKLDRALIERLDMSSRKMKLVRHIVELCHDLGASVVAEGIERDDGCLFPLR